LNLINPQELYVFVNETEIIFSILIMRVYTCRFDKQVPNRNLVKTCFLVDKLEQYVVFEEDRKLASYCKMNFNLNSWISGLSAFTN